MSSELDQINSNTEGRDVVQVSTRANGDGARSSDTKWPRGDIRNFPLKAQRVAIGARFCVEQVSGQFCQLCCGVHILVYVKYFHTRSKDT